MHGSNRGGPGAAGRCGLHGLVGDDDHRFVPGHVVHQGVDAEAQGDKSDDGCSGIGENADQPAPPPGFCLWRPRRGPVFPGGL